MRISKLSDFFNISQFWAEKSIWQLDVHKHFTKLTYALVIKDRSDEEKEMLLCSLVLQKLVTISQKPQVFFPLLKFA